MQPIESETNPFGGVLPKPDALHNDPDAFAAQLSHSVESWRKVGYRLVWLQVPIHKSQLIPIAVAAEFKFHHSAHDYLMLTHQLEEGAFIPAHASHYIGAGGVVLDARDRLLVVSERYHRADNQPPRYKLPGGALHEGEHLAEAVVREVREETGVETRFDALVCFRHWHGYRYGKSDIYFVCRLHPLSEEISIQEEEIAECIWMPVEEYLSSESVSRFNQEIVRAAIDSPGFAPTALEGYRDPAQVEVFFPKNWQQKG